MPTETISPKEAGAIVNRNWRTVVRWAEEGKIRGYKLGGRWEILTESIYQYIQQARDKM